MSSEEVKLQPWENACNKENVKRHNVRGSGLWIARATPIVVIEDNGYR